MDRFVALADPTRRKIVELLWENERTAGAIGAEFPISPPAISQHLKTLREAQLVRVRIDGQRRVYSLDPEGFDEMGGWFDRMRSFWSDRLDRLERELSKGEEK